MKDQKLKVNCVLGDCNQNTLKLDLDRKFLCEVKRYCKILDKHFDVWGWIILRSSIETRKVENVDGKVVYKYKIANYHVVFDRPVSIDDRNSFVAWLYLYTKDKDLLKWFLLQLSQKTWVLFTSGKNNKKPPKIVYKYGSQNHQIAKFLDNRNFILKSLDKLQKDNA